jgi:uncharacterized protein (DUF2062 family)
MKRSAQNWVVVRERAASWLRQGVSPNRLAITLAVGFVLGCIPVIGLPTALCALLAAALRLNLPAIQAANYLAMPFQVALIVPFVRIGGKITPAFARSTLDMSLLVHSPLQLLLHSSRGVAMQLGLLAGQALLAWLVLAVPVMVVLAVLLAGILRRMPVLVPDDSQD